MAHPAFDDADFLNAALALASDGGPAAATVAAISARLKAPTGSFYHRFASRDVLLAELWFRTLLKFQDGIRAALEAGDGLRAALHTPRWCRSNLDEARVLLLYHRDDFLQGDWPDSFRERLAEQGRRGEVQFREFTRATFGRSGLGELRRARFITSEVPVGAVRQYLLRREKPASIVDDLIRTTYNAIVAAYWADKRQH